MNRDNTQTLFIILCGCQEVACRAQRDYSLSLSRDF